MSIGLLVLHLHLPGCLSLKEKRSRIKPLISRLHREFNVSVAEIDQQDAWQQAVIGCAMITSAAVQTRRSLQVIPTWVEQNWPDLELVEDQIEMI